MSTLQDSRRLRYATECYSAGYETWRVRPVMVVQTFAYQLSVMVDSVPMPDHAVRPLRIAQSMRGPGIKAFRRAVAARLRLLRSNGLTAAKVREIVLPLIDAPESYGGVLRSVARDKVFRHIAELQAD